VRPDPGVYAVGYVALPAGRTHAKRHARYWYWHLPRDGTAGQRAGYDQVVRSRRCHGDYHQACGIAELATRKPGRTHRGRRWMEGATQDYGRPPASRKSARSRWARRRAPMVAALPYRGRGAVRGK